MMKTLSFRATTRQQEAVQEATERGFADNESEAARLLIDQGAADLGIVNGNGLQSKADRIRFKRVLEEFAEVAAYVGMSWGLVLTMYPHSSVNWAVVAPLLIVLLVIVTKDLFVKYA